MTSLGQPRAKKSDVIMDVIRFWQPKQPLTPYLGSYYSSYRNFANAYCFHLPHFGIRSVLDAIMAAG